MQFIPFTIKKEPQMVNASFVKFVQGDGRRSDSGEPLATLILTTGEMIRADQPFAALARLLIGLDSDLPATVR